MDIGRDGSFHGYPAQVWPTITPASQDYSDLKMNSTNGLDNGFNNGTIGTSFGGWESSNLWSDDRVSNTHKPGLYDTLFMNNMWSGIPCSDLLALADPAIAVTRCSGDGYDSIIGGGCVSIGRGIYDDNKVSVPSQSQDVGCVPDSPQNEHPDETRYLFDLNSIPILTEPELITSSPSQLPPVTPKPTRRAGQRGKLSSDIIYSTQDETTDQDVINLEQPELIIEQSQDDLEVDEDFEEGSSDDVDLKKTPEPKQRRRKCRTLEQSKLITEQSRGDVWQLEVDEDFVEGSSDGLDFKKTPQPKQRRRRRRKHRKVEQPKVITEQSQDDVRQLEVDEDFEEGSSDDLDLTKTPQPKQRRRKHRPKVVIEGQTKSANKRTTPKPDGSKGNKKYDATGTPTNKGTNEATDRTISRPVRKTCRRRINFGDEWDFEGSDFEFIFENQVLSPITPAKSETKKDAGNKCSKAKQKIDFSRSNIASRDNSSCSTSAGFKKDASGIRYESLEAYRSMIPKFPSTYKRKRTELRYTSITSWAKSSVWSPERLTLNGVNHQSYKNILGFGNLENIRKKRSKGIKRMRDLNALTRMIEGKQHTCMEALAADFGFNRAAKKRTKRNSTMSSSSYYNHWFLTNYIGLQSNFRWKNTYDMDALINQFENLGLKNQRVEQDQKALVPYLTRYQEKKALVPYTTRYRQKNSLVLYQQNRSLVPFEDSDYEEKSGKLRPKVELDDETDRVWRLLLEDINSQGIDGIDEDNSKYWEEERNVFSGRAASFIARMHLVQGDRRFSRWKGSVVDSVTGVFLTQNVSDHLSSSAFINLAARYPLKSKSSTEPLHEEKSSISISEICQLDLEETTRWQDNSNLQPAQPHDSTTPQHTDSYEEKGVVNSNELESIGYSHEQNEGVSEDHITSEIRLPPKNCDIQKVNMLGAIEAEYIELREGRTSMHKKHDEKCVSQQSEISSESANQTTLETVSENSNIVSNQDINDNNCNVQKILGIENSLAEISEVIESNNIVENSTDTVHELIESNENENDNLQATVSGINKGSTLARKSQTRKGKKVKVDWDSLRKSAQVKKKRERTPDTLDSLDYEAVRCADVDEISDAIKDRGMNNMLAERIKEFLNRLVKDHGSIDLEWLRDVPPDKAKEYLLSFRGLGLKSVECVRLLTLHHLAFPVDTNVGRIAVRLGWVPLQPLPESLQLHLLELYPILETIQKYLWPRLCKLDQKTLYELHYQMITFGKVFCTKNKPNCNSCPMRGECRHFASAFASARLSLPATEEKSIVTGTENRTHGQTPTWTTNQPHLSLPPPDDYLQQESGIQNHDPFVEEPTTPEPIVEVPATPELEQTQQEFDIEDFGEDPEEIPTITLNMEAFTQNLQTYMENNMELADGDMSRALVALTSEAASIPTPKLKNVSQLRTEHQVYELPDSHPLLEGLDKREPDDPCSYLLAIWTPGETAESIQPPKGQCNSQESDTLCHKETCFWCNSMREANSQTVRGTLLIPCRTAMRGSFPLNGTYFQVNEVFADHDSSLNPINVPRSWLWNLPRRTVYFGTSIPTIFRGLTTEGIQYCFWRGFVCVRGFDQKTRAPRPLMARLHFPVSKLKRSRGKPDED